MGQARRRGTLEERVAQAKAEGRDKSREVIPRVYRGGMIAMRNRGISSDLALMMVMGGILARSTFRRKG